VELRTYWDARLGKKIFRDGPFAEERRPTAADFPSVTLGRAQTISGNAAIVLSWGEELFGQGAQHSTRN